MPSFPAASKMYSFESSVSASSRYRKVVAGVAVALVLALTALAASPTLHAHLHGAAGDTTLADDGCAVALFASGVTLALGLTLLQPRARPAGTTHSRPAALFVRPPRYLRQPERGPPVS